MKTIGVKYLRQNLDEVLDRVIAGEDIIIQHRFKKPVRMSAVNKMPGNERPKLAGLKAFEDASRHPSPFSSNKTIRELYRESISNKQAS